jgi:hypothetical protein
MTHIWEDPTMIYPQNMQTQALDPLRNGDQGTPGLAQFVVPGGDFENIPENEVRAFIVTPFYFALIPDQPANSLRYQDGVDQIRELLKDILGRSDTIIIPYVSTFPDDEFNYASGKILIQYDPVNEWSPAEGCNIQFAGIELWVEDHPVPQFRDVWNAFPNQIPSPGSLAGRSLSGEGREVGVLGHEKAPAFEEEGWKEYEALRRRAFCVRPSKSVSASSALSTSSSSPSSVTQDPTTFQTSVIPSSSAGSSTFSSTPTSSSDPPSPPTPTSSKALEIIMHYSFDNLLNGHWNSFFFFETKVGVSADGCGTPTYFDPKGNFSNELAINQAFWPSSTSSYSMTLFGEENCTFFTVSEKLGGNLHCPSMKEGNNVTCIAHPEKTQVDAIHKCPDDRYISTKYHRVGYCEW